MVSTIDVCRTVLEHLLDEGAVVRGDGGEKCLGFTDVDLFAPFADVDRLETSCQGLTTRIVLDEAVL